jgi:hypothetical protein
MPAQRPLDDAGGACHLPPRPTRGTTGAQNRAPQPSRSGSGSSHPNEIGRAIIAATLDPAFVALATAPAAQIP